MFRKIVISVLVILAGVIVFAGIADLAGWGLNPICSGELFEGSEACIGVFRGDLTVSYEFPTTDPYVYSVHAWMGFGFIRNTPEFAPARSFLDVYCPFWLPVLLLAAYPILVLIKTIRGRPKPGHCSKCGYNLTGNKSGVCPECGTPITDGEPPIR